MGKITYSIKKKIGEHTHTFLVEGDTFFDVVMQSKKLSFHDVEKCGLCNSTDLELGARKAQEKFKYVFIKCKKCKASLNFGQKQEDPETFYLRTREETTGNKTHKVLDWEQFKPDTQQ